MRLLLIVFCYPDRNNPYKGIFFKTQATQLREAGHEIEVIEFNVLSVRRFSECKISKINGKIPISRILIPNILPKSTLGIVVATLICGLFLSIVKIRCKPDVIHSMGIFTPSLLGTVLSRVLRVPHIISEHRRSFANKMSFIERVTVKYIYDKANRITATSAHFALLQNSQYAHVTAARFTILPPFVNMARVARQPQLTVGFTTRMNLEPLHSIVVVGSLIPLKNTDKILEAFCLEPTLWRHWRLDIIGEGELMNRLKEFPLLRSREPGFNVPTVKLHGALDQDELAKFYSRASLLCHASDRETFGCAPLEAMLFGIPVLLSRCGGPFDYFDTSCGVLLEDTTVRGIRSGLLDICSRINEFTRERIYRTAHEKYDLRKVTSYYIDLYRESSKFYKSQTYQ